MNYEEAAAYLLDIPRFAAKTSHENLNGFLNILGNPQVSVPAVHVAGTNGKGSVCAFLASILQQAGYRVGLFTSPHLVRINERFQINSIPISDEAFLSVFLRVQEAVKTGISRGMVHPNFFEFVFLMAVCWYEEEGPDYVIYETGLGGRLDATNVLQPCLTILTSIGMDHMQYLGDTLEQIAGEKAGILKADIPCIYMHQPDVTSDVIQGRASELACPLIPVEKDRITIDEIQKHVIDFSYVNRYDNRYNHNIVTYRMKKTALYQAENAALAIEAGYYLLTEYQKLTDEEAAVRAVHQGILHMRWQGRMEELEPGVYVDGAHNEPAIRAFCDTVTRLYQDKKVILLFAVASDKLYNEMIRILCEMLTFETVIVTAIPGSRTTPVEQAAEQFQKFRNGEVLREPDSEKALGLAKRSMTSDSRIFCTGSLYLVGSLKQGRRTNHDQF